MVLSVPSSIACGEVISLSFTNTKYDLDPETMYCLCLGMLAVA